MNKSGRIDITDQGVQKALDQAVKAGTDPKPMLDDIRELLVLSTLRRFSDSVAPDGSKWAPNSQVTILQYLGQYSGSFSKKGGKKGGKLTAKGAGRVMSKKPLIGETGDLSSQFSWQIEGGNTLLIGTNVPYAAAQQFGMKKGYAGTSKHGSPIPWGDIPARAFLGVSDSDSRSILDIIEEHYSPR